VKPGHLSAGLAVLAGSASVSASGVTPSATIIGGVGLAVLVASILRRWPTGVSLGGIGLVGALPFAALGGATPTALVLAATTAALAYDLGEERVETHRLLDGKARTVRAEGVHALGSGLLVGVTAGGSLLAFELATGHGSTLAVAALLIGATALLAATRVD